jgi:hypothetical protein
MDNTECHYENIFDNIGSYINTIDDIDYKKFDELNDHYINTYVNDNIISNDNSISNDDSINQENILIFDDNNYSYETSHNLNTEWFGEMGYISENYNIHDFQTSNQNSINENEASHYYWYLPNYNYTPNYYEHIERFIKYAKYIIHLHQDEIERLYVKVKNIDKTITEKTTKLEICKHRLNIMNNMSHLYKFIEYVMATKVSVEYILKELNSFKINKDDKYNLIHKYREEIQKLLGKYELLCDKIYKFDKNRNIMIEKSIKYIEKKEKHERSKNKRKYSLIE